MQVPVIIELPHQLALQQSATNAWLGTRRGILQSTRLPKSISVDISFPAVPIGNPRRIGESPILATPQNSDFFAVRGFIEADSIDSVPHQIEELNIYSDPHIEPFITCGSDLPVGDAALVAKKIDVASLNALGLDGTGVAIAIFDTGINLKHLRTKLGIDPAFDASNSWMPPGVSGILGGLPVDHGTMCAYDALIVAPKATLLDFPILLGNAPGGSAMGSFLSVAISGYAQLIAFWASAFAPDGANKYRALVVNNSWGMFNPSWDFPVGHPGRYSDNPSHPFNQLVSMLSNSKADILFAAGNCGADCPDGRCKSFTVGTILGANALPDVLTIAGCDTNDERVGYSSQGPAITGMAEKKPDLVAYTHFLGSESFASGLPDSGTSAACPVASGCVAALRTRVSPVDQSPADLKTVLIATARRSSTEQWSNDYGSGIIDPVSTAKLLGILPNIQGTTADA